MSLEDRCRLVQDMVKTCGSERVRFQQEIKDVLWDDDMSAWHVSVHCGQRKTLSVLFARTLIIAPGRFGPTAPWMSAIAPSVFRRVEVGVRVEAPSDASVWTELRGTDPKLLRSDHEQGLEWRTFCCCRDGVTELTHVEGRWTWSGRADVAPTGKSNMGFNVRWVDEKGQAEWLMHDRWLPGSRKCDVFHMSVREMVDQPDAPTGDKTFLGPFRGSFLRGLRALVKRFPSLLDQGTISGPTLEGVGNYPDIDEKTLANAAETAFVAGDASGIFRGIVAAMVSGVACASQAATAVHHK